MPKEAIMNKFYITTAIPYVNAPPHIGHALEFVQADVIARYHHLIGDDAILLSGGDENALKNVQAAEKAKIPVQEFIDQNSKLFEELAEKLNVKFDIFQKGSDLKHHKSSQKLWEFCNNSGDIYKKSYTGLYCVGCETFYEKGELDENGECFEHPGKKLEEVSEENYFFKLSKYQDQLLELLETGRLRIIPESRKNEAISFIKQGLKDISISRSNERAKNWGVDVPGDKTQKIYVWFDALNIYQSGIGFELDGEKYKKWWPADVHVIGKGILRFHAIYWPAFLLSAGLPLPKSLFVHGYLTINGQKMSKTLTRFKEVYNADLANGLGNLVARVARLCENAEINFDPNQYTQPKLNKKIKEYLEKFQFNRALEYIWGSDIKWGLRWLDQEIDREQPWAIKDRKKLEDLLIHLYVFNLRDIAYNLRPFLPETAEKILNQFSGKIKSSPPLFPRI
ncbi:MAG: Methionine-tRNA ligase [Candidatus Levybacteria bacterium GW2011_GWA2_36_13]|nr:MAG: Methionine-tRNA ligase [Candidatus Levybacteria bacterium GW2011_GWA2_36_13]